MDDKVFGDLAKCLLKVLPEKWEKVALYYRADKDVFDLNFYVWVGGISYNCFGMGDKFGISEGSVYSVFFEIHEGLSAYHEQEKWYAMTFLLWNDGNLKVEYQYDDHSDSTFEYWETWKLRYVNNGLQAKADGLKKLFAEYESPADFKDFPIDEHITLKFDEDKGTFFFANSENNIRAAEKKTLRETLQEVGIVPKDELPAGQGDDGALPE